MNYYKLYQKRLNRFGKTYQERLLGARKKSFDEYLEKSSYRVVFEYDYELHVGSFEKYKQDETKTLHYLLTYLDLIMPNGTILKIPDPIEPEKEEVWMVYYLESIQASGYNRYIMLRMSHFFTWKARDGEYYSTYAYLYGQEDNMLKDEIKSRSRMDTIYAENLKSSFFIAPVNPNINKDDYLIVGEKPLQEYYRVTGYDRQSNVGIEFVTIDPVYEFDLTPPPAYAGEDPEKYYWFNGGEDD